MEVPVGLGGVPMSLNGQGPPTGPEISYNIPGVLHFVKSEWVRFERERAAWELEKVELQSKIAFLNGQRKGHEHLKRDLIRRIKMLEFALKQERSKNHKLVYGTELSIPDNKIEFEAEPEIVSSSTNLIEGRNILRQYLRELGYTEGVLEARAKVKNVRSYPEAPITESEVVFLTHDTQDNDPEELKGDELGDSELSLINPVTTFDETADFPPRPNRPLQEADSDTTGFSQKDETLAGDVTHPGDQDVTEAFEEFSFLKSQEGGNSDDGSSADDEDEASFERSKQTKKLKSLLNTYAPDSSAQQTADREYTADSSAQQTADREYAPDSSAQQTADLSPTADKSAEESRWNEGLLPEEMESMKDQMRKTAEARKQKKSRPSREELNTMRTVLQDEEGVFETETLTKQSLLSAGMKAEGPEPGSQQEQGERSSQEAFQPFQGLGDATKDRDLYGPLAMISVKGDLDMEAGFGDATRKMWEQRFCLQSHYDSVTTLEFHPSEAFLLTASEDTTVKLWNFDLKTGLNVSKKPGVVDLEPVHTFRAHEAAITSLAISRLTPRFYTGDINGNICTWSLNTSIAPYDEYDPQLLEETTAGHQNAIWDLAVHPTQDLLISAGADGICKLWKQFNVAEFVMGEKGENFQPTSLCILSPDPHLLAVSYSNARTAIFDINTEKLVTSLRSYDSYDGTQGTQINRVVSHPNSSVVITAHEDKQINFFDYRSGEILHSMIAHQDAVTGLDVDSQGLFVLTSGHDRSLRLWDYHSKSCIQEISTHWSKFDQGISVVRFHPALSYFASGGADSLAKIFMKRKEQ